MQTIIKPSAAIRRNYNEIANLCKETKGERLQRCRNNAFMFRLDEESRPYVKSLLLHEVKAVL